MKSIYMSSKWNVFLLSLALLFLCQVSVFAKGLILAENGKTDYVIVAPANLLPMEKLAVRELQDGLRRTTGANFKAASAGAKKIMLVRDPSLAPQECELSCVGNNLILKGGDRYGIVYAVYTFLEDQLGIRWFTRYGVNKYPKIKRLKVDFAKYRKKPAYPERYLIMASSFKRPETTPFYFRNRMNFGNFLKNSKDLPGADSLFVECNSSCHTLFFLIPPAKNAYPQQMKFKTTKYYFKSNPEYFSLDQNGKRTIHMQLCFSNPELRKELTRRLFESIEVTGKKTGVYSVSAQDCSGIFCHCKGCKALTAKYRSNSGPLVDYLLELCPKVKKAYPGLYISTLAYRRDQTEKPPFLNGKKMPDNFICIFASIEDDFSKSMDHPNNQLTLKHLRGWADITRHVWMWYYPLVYGGTSPFISLERNVKDIRLMLKHGATGAYFEHDVGLWDGCNLVDMLNWLYLKLIQDPDQDHRKLVAEYCDFIYGAASKDMQTYIYEMDEYTKKHKTYAAWSSGPIQAALSPKNLLRWAKLFDRMEKAVAKDPQALAHVRDVRFMLDIVTLSKYRAITNGKKGILPPPEVIRDRTLKNIESAIERRIVGPFATMRKGRVNRYRPQLRRAYILATFVPKKLDAPLDKVDPKKVRQLIPSVVNRCGIVKMKDAAFGEAIFHPTKGFELPFTCGFYDNNSRKFLLNRKITAKEIVPDKFHLYKVGSAPIGTGGYIWTMSNWKVGISASSLYIPGEATNKKYDIWLSIKFEGPGYSKKSKAKENRFYIDRAIVVDPD